MTATRPRLTAPPAGLLEAVDARYDGAPFTPDRSLRGGYANDVFLVRSRLGAVVLRVKYPPSDDASIRWEHDLVARLAARVPEVVEPLRACDGSTFFVLGGDAVSLLPYVDADHAGTEHAAAAAILLAKLHAAGASLHVPPRPGLEGLAQVRTLDTAALPTEWRGRAGRTRAQALELLDRLDSRDLVTGIVHGDIYRGNLLVRDGQIVAIIDWEEAHVAPLVSDLANLVWEFAKDETRDDFDRDLGDKLVTAYRGSGGPVPAGELDLIVPLIRAKRVLELLRAPGDRHVDWSYQEQNLRAAERLR